MTINNNGTFVVVDHEELTAAETAFAERFGARVIGQPGALTVAQLAHNMATNKLRDKTRPVGIFYLAGPSRTGKSLTGVVLAEIFHNNPDALTRIQASDYTEDHQLLELKGAPPSYVGYRDPKDPKNKLEGHETDPYSIVSSHNLRRVRLGSNSEIDIVVIEEFEKSTPDFYKFWMGVFDKGVARLGNGDVADFRNTIFILTSNIGMDELEKRQTRSIGFVNRETKVQAADVESVVEEAMRRTYKPEFRNRLDAIVVFRPFSSDTLMKIVDAELGLLQDRINTEMPAGEDFMLIVSDEAKTHLLKSVDNNVAELKRVLNRDVLMPLGRLLNGAKVKGGDIVRIDVDGGKLSFRVASDALGVGEHEKEIRKLGPKAGVVNMSLQREVRKAALNARSQKSEIWSVIMTGGSKELMMSKAVELLGTIERVLELQVNHVGYERVAPFIFSAIVVGTKEQMNILARIHQEDNLMINAAATKLLPVS
ncbi:MAG: AAA family ATPase [Candidatus Obscuribacterales bacterium]|nr:AAA family ATPase [Candidatus Obscuribacterales bacterium]